MVRITQEKINLQDHMPGPLLRAARILISDLVFNFGSHVPQPSEIIFLVHDWETGIKCAGVFRSHYLWESSLFIAIDLPHPPTHPSHVSPHGKGFWKIVVIFCSLLFVLGSHILSEDAALWYLQF